jgi:hypothetical protein
VNGAPRDLYVSREDYVIVHMSAVKVLGSWEAAGCWQRIAFRCEPTGEWRATMAEIAAEIGVSERTAKRITTMLRDKGWLHAERRDPQVPTLTWSVPWGEGHGGTHGEGHGGTHGLTSQSATVTPSPEGDTVAPGEGHGDPQQSDTVALTSTKNEEHDKNNPTAAPAAADEGAKATRGMRLPADWEPSDHLKDWFRQQPFMTFVHPWAETTKFKDYWVAQPGQRGVKRDWDATWRNWMRTAAERAGWRPAPDTDGAPGAGDTTRRGIIEAFGG